MISRLTNPFSVNNVVTKIVKRDGRVVTFDSTKILLAIANAARATKETLPLGPLTDEVVSIINRNFNDNTQKATVEDCQDIVEDVLIEHNYAKTAKEYILYRAERTRIREMNTKLMRIYEDLTFKEARDNDAKRENLVTAFQDIQEAEGYISPEAIAEVSKYFDISRADAYSVVSFYAQFKFKKPGKHIIKVCKGTACHVRGSGNLLSALEERLGIKEGETTSDGMVSLERVACLGACALAPAMVVDEKVYGRVTLAELDKILKGLK